MSEPRFYITDTGLGLDTESDEMYSFGDEEDFCRLFDKLNEQQATISTLEEENDILKQKLRKNYIANKQYEEMKRLQKENEQLSKELKELEKNFDDLVQWASEIAKRNVVLDEQIGELQRENEQLRKELGDCEKFRYRVFKRLNDEYIKECSIK